jgi:hypothetical protein
LAIEAQSLSLEEVLSAVHLSVQFELLLLFITTHTDLYSQWGFTDKLKRVSNGQNESNVYTSLQNYFS